MIHRCLPIAPRCFANELDEIHGLVGCLPTTGQCTFWRVCCTNAASSNRFDSVFLLQNLLSKKAVKVFLFAYMRGGSTLGGQMFNLEPKSTLWYEPGDPFYSTYFGIEGNLPQNDVYNRDMTRRYLYT